MQPLFSALLPSLFHGVPCAGKPSASGPPPECSVADIFKVVANLIQILLVLAGILSVIFIIIGGIQYIMSAGNPSGVAKAKLTLTYAIGGLVLAIGATALVSYVGGVFK
jgi:Type IV secretion system pilin